MLKFQATRILESIEQPVAQGNTITAEGAALVADYTNGEFGVKQSTGTANDKFYGVSIAQQLSILFLPEYVTLVADGSHTLPHTPASGTLLVFNETTGSPLATAGGAPAAGEYNLAGNVITFNSAQDGQTIRIGYRYSPTMIEARLAQGDIPPGGAANLTLDTMGVILKGQVSTTEFDTSINWNVANPVLHLGANGLFNLGGGTSVAVPGAVIVELPTAEDSFLTFQI